MPCGLSDPIGCVTGSITNTVGGAIVGDVASAAWDSICKSFADAATEVLKAFAKAFVAIPNIDVSSHGIRSTYAISLGLAGLVAALLLIGQVVRTAVTHDGRALATGLVGVGKAALAFMLTLIISSTALQASDEATKYIVDNTMGGTQTFSDKIAKLIAWSPGISATLLLIFALIGILLTIVLWFEMLMRNAAIAVLIATSPIAAAGQISESSKSWWSKLVSSTTQLIILKPVVALVFALGFNIAGDSQDFETTLSGMLILLLAALAWPAIARFFSFASVQVGGGAGLAALLGFAGGRLTAATAGGPTGASPDSFGEESAQRTMASFTSRGGTPAGGMAREAGTGAAAGTGTAAGGAGGPVGAIAAAGVRLAQQAVNSLAGGMEKTAANAGIQGANPYAAQPAGYVNRHAGTPLPTSGLLPDQPTPDWSNTDGTDPAAPVQADHRQAEYDSVPELPVTDQRSAPAPSDPPTIEFPVLPAELDNTAPSAPTGTTGGGATQPIRSTDPAAGQMPPALAPLGPGTGEPGAPAQPSPDSTAPTAVTPAQVRPASQSQVPPTAPNFPNEPTSKLTSPPDGGEPQ